MRSFFNFGLFTLALLPCLSDCGRITDHFGPGGPATPESPPPDGSTGSGSGGAPTSPPDHPPHTVTVNWVASTDPEINGYHLFRGQVSGGPYTVITTTATPTVTYLDANITPGNTYYYVVTAFIVSPYQESPQSGESPPAKIPTQ